MSVFLTGSASDTVWNGDDRVDPTLMKNYSSLLLIIEIKKGGSVVLLSPWDIMGCCFTERSVKALIQAVTKMSKKDWGFVANLWLVRFPASPISVLLGPKNKGCCDHRLFLLLPLRPACCSPSNMQELQHVCTCVFQVDWWGLYRFMVRNRAI